MKVSHYPVRPGLFAGEYPGHPTPALTGERLKELAELGITDFVDLTSQEDRTLGLEAYDPYFLPDSGMVRHSFPIPDMGIPHDPGVMRGVLDTLREAMAAGRTCYVHCWGGIGRTGTAIACWLREEEGLTADAALAEVQTRYSSHMRAEKLVRYPKSPQQPSQVRYVREWI